MPACGNWWCCAACLFSRILVFWIQRDVVIEELADESDARRHAWIVEVIGAEHRLVDDRLDRVAQVVQRIQRPAEFAQALGLLAVFVGLQRKRRQQRKHAGKGGGGGARLKARGQVNLVCLGRRTGE
jgi:hypothetical protein